MDDITYPGDPPTELRNLASFAAASKFALSSINMTVHAGTHIDAPSHFFEGGQTIASLPLERFHLTAHVLDVGDTKVIEARHLSPCPAGAGEALLLKTRNAYLPRDTYEPEHARLSIEGALFLVNQGISLIGIDYVSIESGDGYYPVHRELLGSGILILEDIDLRSAEPGKYKLICFPLLIADSEASPCRAVLVTSLKG
jgi:arylformamidase